MRSSRIEAVCPERMRLLDEYTTATAALYAATVAIAGKTGAELQRALKATASARAQCAKKREAMAIHKAEHHCRKGCDRHEFDLSAERVGRVEGLGAPVPISGFRK